MDPRRIGKAVASRWVVVLAIALLGLIAALVLTELDNRSGEQVFEATTAIAFEPEEGETIADLADEIQAAQDFAVIAAGDLLAEDPDLRIVEDLADARLEFIAVGPSEASAGAKAQALLQSFLETDPSLREPVADLIEQLEQDAVAIQGQIDALNPPFTTQEEELIERHQFLDEQINLIKNSLVSMVIDESAADVETRAALESQRAFLERRLTELEAEKGALPPIPTRELTIDDQLLLTTLERRMEQITARFEQLYLRQLGVTGSGEIEPVTFRDLTQAPLNPWVNGSLGFAGGLLIAIAALSFLTRTRQTVWLRGDVGVPVLGQIPGRRVGHNVLDEWYDRAEPGPRKTAIQALRSAVEALLPPTRTTIGITRHETSDDMARALAADLAASLATAGKSVLLIDADFKASGEIGRYRVGGASLSGVLKLNPAAPEFEAEVRHAPDTAYLIREGLAVIPAGPSPDSPADALAGQQFRSLVAAAQDRYDVVLVVVPDLDDPTALVPLQRLEFGIVAITPGKTTMPDLNGLLEDAHRLRISMLGAVFVSEQGRIRRFLDSRKPSRTISQRGTETSDEVESIVSPISRLQNYYPIPEEHRTALVSHSHIRDLTDQIDRQSEGSRVSTPTAEQTRTFRSDTAIASQGQADLDGARSGLGGDLLEALSGSSEEKAYAAVADYLVARTEDMVTARYGIGDYSDELIHEISESGFVSLRPLRDNKTAASWLKLEIEREVDRKTAKLIISEMERIISAVHGQSLDLDEWLAREFFSRHLRRTDGEPRVWKLASPDGTIQILVPAARLTRRRVEHLMDDVASAALDELMRLRDAADTRGDPEQVELYENSIADAREFKAGLEQIAYGLDGSGNSAPVEAWIPDWSQGVGPNLAIFRNAGLVPPVDVANEASTGVAGLS